MEVYVFFYRVDGRSEDSCIGRHDFFSGKSRKLIALIAAVVHSYTLLHF